MPKLNPLQKHTSQRFGARMPDTLSELRAVIGSAASLGTLRRHRVTRSNLLIALLLSAIVVTDGSAQQDKGRVSSFGRYEGYSPQLYDEWVNSSVYVGMRDGVRLAVDITRPAVDGVAVDSPYPVVWAQSRYHRNLLAPNRQGTNVDAVAGLQRLVKHGYVVCAAAIRGTGASFGRCEEPFSATETEDAVELIGWFAEQPWCDGNVGMYGLSYLGITQYMVASHAPPALKAIFPDVAGFDLYDFVHAGGIFRQDAFQHWSDSVLRLDTGLAPRPVDADPGGEWIREAIREHEDNWDVMLGFSSVPFRDSDSELHDWSRHGPSVRIEEIRAAAVPAYHINGWFDAFTLDATLWYANSTGPQRLTIGAWSHTELTPRRMALTAVEQHRWFDRWLKGIENGVDTEPPVQYALMRGPGDWSWEVSETWPVTATKTLHFAFDAGPSGSVDSVNDGLLARGRGVAGHDEYQVDPTTTSGSHSRWDDAMGQGPMSYDELHENDRKSLTYTSAVLSTDLAVVGHPIVRLFVTSSSGDADLHVLLEEVDEEGEVQYVTEGMLRASLRKLSEAPYGNLGLPFQMCLEGDSQRLSSEEPAEILMDLQPTANVFNAGHRLRISIMGADQDNTAPSPVVADTLLGVFRGPAHPSGIDLPVLR